MSNKEHHHIKGHPTVGHVSPIPQLLLVFGALVALTIITVLLSGKLPGATGMFIAMGIATVKATLVALYFMHLRYDRPFNGYLFLASMMFAAVFFGIAMLDSSAYRKDVLQFEAAESLIEPDPQAQYPRNTSGVSSHTSNPCEEAADAAH